MKYAGKRVKQQREGYIGENRGIKKLLRLELSVSLSKWVYRTEK